MSLSHCSCVASSSDCGRGKLTSFEMWTWKIEPGEMVAPSATYECDHECDLNPGKFNCPHCKGFKQYGICSHVLAINHILMAINLRREFIEIGKATMKKKGGGARMSAEPALTQVSQADPDSSDDELMELAGEGRTGQVSTVRVQLEYSKEGEPVSQLSQLCISFVSALYQLWASLIRVSGLYQRCIRRTEGDVADTCIRTVSGMYQDDIT